MKAGLPELVAHIAPVPPQVPAKHFSEMQSSCISQLLPGPSCTATKVEVETARTTATMNRFISDST